MKFLEPIIKPIAPHECLSCEKEGALLCDWCRLTLGPVPSRCYRCRSQAVEYATCVKCRRSSPLEHVWIVSEYQGVSKRLVGKLKFERAKAAATEIADIMAEALPFLPGNMLVSFVPTATNRRRQRGYDQSELIAQRVARLRSLEFCQTLRRLDQSRQVGSSGDKRKKQLIGAFTASKPAYTKNKSILLVDDIVTTGATLEEAAKTLKRAGAKHTDGTAFCQ